MPRLLFISLAVACWLIALQQVRMYLIYAGKVYSPTIGAIEGGPTLRAIALRSAATFTAYGFCVLLVPWPRTLTYLSLIWFCRALLDAVLSRCGRGVHAADMAIMTAKGQRQQKTGQILAVVTQAAIVVACAYFFGF